MQCKDVMRRPVESVRQAETVQAAAARMRDANIGFLPVCDDRGRAVGVLTDRDIAVRLCAEGVSARDSTVLSVMTPEVIRCKASDDLRVAEQLMVRERKSRVVVVDDDERLAGVISLSDVAAHAAADAAEVLRQVAARELLDARGARPRGRDQG